MLIIENQIPKTEKSKPNKYLNPIIKMKAIKYLTLTNLTMLGFKTTKDLFLLDQLYTIKDNLIQFLTTDILYETGIPIWQCLLFLMAATPAMIINQKSKKK